MGPHKRMGEEEAAGGHKHLGRGGLRVWVSRTSGEDQAVKSAKARTPLSTSDLEVRSSLEKKLQNHPHPRLQMTTPNPGAVPPLTPCSLPIFHCQRALDPLAPPPPHLPTLEAGGEK